jgi:tyrosyl-tRNA synthetase
MYPLLQAYDSVAIQADVEFGAMDQKFNNLAGRELQTSLGLPPQDVFLTPLLPGTDGRKMSKSLGNTIDFTDPPDQMYGKAMSISDDMLDSYLTLATEIPDEELEQIRHGLAAGTVNPRDVKMRVAHDIVRQFRGAGVASQAQAEFVRIFQQHELPNDMPIYRLPGDGPVGILELLMGAGLAQSSSEARRLVAQGGVRVDDAKVEDIQTRVAVKDGTILRVGKRKFAKIVRAS